MSGSAPLVLSCIVPTEEEYQFHFVDLEAPKPEPPPSRPLSIVSRRAFGVYPSNDADKEVKALHLETHLADAPALSHLTAGGEGASRMFIHAVDKNLIVIGSCFPEYSPVYLVYDAVEQSITMINGRPWSLIPEDHPGLKRDIDDAYRVLIAHSPGPGGHYALVKMAETTIYNKGDDDVEKQDLLYVWRSSSRQWSLIRASFPSQFKGDNVANSYTSVLAFACGGHAFWADLLRGVIYCRVDAMLSAAASTRGGGGPKLKFGFINLPVEHPCPITRAMHLDLEMCRTIGRSGESSINFVAIDGFVQLRDFVDCTLKLWSLSPEDVMSMTGWTERALCMGNLAEQDEFKKAGLPTDMVPMYPSLNPEEEDVVYFMLGEYKKCCYEHKRSKKKCDGYIPQAKNPRYHLRVDMRRGLLLASARLPERMSPSVSLASTSVVPTSMIRRGSRARSGTTVTGRKNKRRRGDGNRKKGGRCEVQ